MDGLALLVGHLLGDYWPLQNDWLAKNKTNPHPGKEPHPNLSWIGCAPAPKREYPGPWSVSADPGDTQGFRTALEERNRKIAEWEAAEDARIESYMNTMNSQARMEQRKWFEAKCAYRKGHIACTLHCFLYTLSIWLFSFWWMPWWGLLVCFTVHWPIDRFRLAPRAMKRFGQKEFATGPMSPWSIIVVDNSWHLLTLVLIGLAARGV